MSIEDNRLMPSTLDRQIDTPGEDAFGHRHFAEGLRSLIESPEHVPPFSIGLLGGWGTGKSTIKELYIRALRDDARRNRSGHSRCKRIHTITFNAWRFGGKEQDIKRALLRHFFPNWAEMKKAFKIAFLDRLVSLARSPKGFANTRARCSRLG